MPDEQQNGEIILCTNRSCTLPGRYYCSRCMAAAYCSQKCQQTDWKADHKVQCQHITKIAKEILSILQDCYMFFNPWGPYAGDFKETDPNTVEGACVYVELDPQTSKVRKFASTLDYPEAIKREKRVSDGRFFVVVDLEIVFLHFEEDEYKTQADLFDEKTNDLYRLIGTPASLSPAEQCMVVMRALQGALTIIDAGSKSIRPLEG